MGRDSVSGAGLQNFTFALHKEFRITESQRFEFRGEFFNLLNHTNLDPQKAGAPGDMNFSSSSFNTVVQARPARQIQLSLRYGF
jgi:hypothetical protein